MKHHFQHALWLFILVPAALLLGGCTTPTPIKQVTTAKPIEVQKLDKKRPIMFAKIVVKAKRGDEIGTVYEGLLDVPKTKLYWRKGGYLNFSDEDLNQRFREALEAANYEVVGDPSALFDDASAWKAELLVAGVVTDLKVSPHYPAGGLGDFRDSRATAYLKVEWQVYSRLSRQVVLKLVTEGSVDQKKSTRNGADEALGDAFSNAIENLLAEKQFYDLVVSSGEPKMEGRSVSIHFKDPERSGVILEKMPDIQTSVATIFAGDGLGSGFVISEDGYLLSNQHVVGDSRYVRIKFSTGVEVNGEVVSIHRGRDIALLKCGAQGLKCLPVRREIPKTGEEVYAIGTPGPAGQRLNETVTKGIVSGYRNLNGINYIQSDAAINPGNSGGPLLDKNGNVIGVSVLKRFDAEGLGFFIPIDEAIHSLQIQ